MDKKYSVVILGASGYTASELIRLCVLHPEIEIKYLVGNSAVGKEVRELYPHLKFADLPRIIKLEEVKFSGIDLVFSCLPHGVLHESVGALPQGIKIIDLSADFRLRNLELYKEFYTEHHNAELLRKSVYGLSEILDKNSLDDKQK